MPALIFKERDVLVFSCGKQQRQGGVFFGSKQREMECYFDNALIYQSFEEKSAVSIEMDAPEMITVDQPFELKIEIINNWKIPLNNVEFGLRKESGFSLVPNREW